MESEFQKPSVDCGLDGVSSWGKQKLVLLDSKWIIGF